MRTITLTAATVLALAGCGSGSAAAGDTPTPTPTTFRVWGNLQIWGSSCSLPGGYDDIAAGAQVTVTDGTGATVALGRLGPGKFLPKPDYPQVGTCVFPINVDGVPRGRGFYGVEVTHHGVQRYAEADITTTAVELKLG